MQELAVPIRAMELLCQAQSYLKHRERNLPADPKLEAAWIDFFELYSPKIRRFAYTCGATEDDIADCLQEVWAELLVRLPTFQLDPKRGKFDTWLFHIVRGKAADLCRCRKSRCLQEFTDALQSAVDVRPNPCHTMEAQEILGLAWDELKRSLSECNFQVLQMRLVEQRPVPEVAEALGLSHEQVWYRYHRARREAEQIGSSLSKS
ncbi:MAG: sigma-70 family RNA polymerase sigma factor [Planctomycetes bacterium]|nr:sigma-70 family RNA polymerase sigma factor [Planctomycetota bacterium]